MKSRRAAVALTCCLATAWHGAAEGARKPTAPTLGTLGKKTVPIDRTTPVQATADDAARSYETFLAIEDADPVLRTQALRRLGDLRLERAVTLSGAGELPDPATVDMARQAAAAYRELLARFPDAPAQDAVLYQLARAQELAGEPTTALATLDRLVTRFPTGAHADEAQFRRGEAFFSARRYADAEHAYAAVLDAQPASAFREQALYKRGWAQFKLGDDGPASASFLALLDRLLVRDGGLREEEQLSRPERELADDSLRALSVMFMANEGARSLQAALAQRGVAPYEARLYRALGDLYVEKERFQDGAEVYRAYARREPLDVEAPLLLGLATEAYARAGFVALVLESKQELVELYGPSSVSWRERGAAGIDPRVRAAVQANLLDLARHHHALAQKSGAGTDRDAAVRWYREFLTGFDTTTAAPATRLLLADLLFEGARYAEAATEYEIAAYGYAEAPEAARAGYAALVALDKAAPQASAAEQPSFQTRTVELSLKFADTFPAHAETPGLLTRSTKLLFDANDRLRAEAVAQRVLALGPRADAGQQLVAWTVLAHTYFDSGRYGEAERAYGEMAARLPATDPQRAEATERLAAAVYRQAEQRQAAGDVQGAVQDFLRVAQVAPASPVRVKAEYDAATLLFGAKQWAQGAAVLERFRVDHPDHELTREVATKLAAAYVEAGRPVQAAAEYERVAVEPAQAPDVQRAALLTAGELYVGAGDKGAAARVYAGYVQRFPSPALAAIEARQALADLAREAGDVATRTRWLDQIVVADRAAGSERNDRTKFLAAGAALELARPRDAAARAVRLALPLEKTFGAKRKALEAALDAYGAAEAYGIAQVSTAATYAMADLYRELGRALLESDRPPGLDAEELEQYTLLLEEQAFPFEEKAIGLHERNVRLAAQGIYDESVQRSYVDLAQLKPARYARTERVVEPAPQPVAPALDAAAANRDGVALRRAGDFRAARAAYERALMLDPTLADAERNLAILHDLYLDDPAAALPHYERYETLTQGADEEVKAWLVELRRRLAAITRTAGAQP